MIKFYPAALVIFIVFLFANCGGSRDKLSEHENQPKFQVEIKATKTTSYCGGARPTPEIEKSHRTKRPYANTTVYIRKGSKSNYLTPAFATVKTDSLGMAKIGLPEGDFVFVFENKANENTFEETLKLVDESPEYRSIDKECLQRFYEKPDAQINVTKDSENRVVMHRHFKCAWSELPCAVYVGDLPPSARLK
jgi:hypothetical protein